MRIFQELGFDTIKTWIFGVCPYTWGIYPQQIVFFGKIGVLSIFNFGAAYSQTKPNAGFSDMMISSSNQGYKRDTIGRYSVYWYKLVKDLG